MTTEVYLRSDGIGYQSRGRYFNTVGYICGRDQHSDSPCINVSQESNSWWGWCVSSWATIPHDELWTDETFVAKVKFHNLDFIGTPFEHRYNEYV